MSDMTGLPPVDPQVTEGPQGSTGPDLPMMAPPIDAPPPVQREPLRGYSSSQFPTDPYLQQQEAQRRQQDDLSVMLRIRQAITEGDADAVAEAERLSLKTGLTISSIRNNANTARGIAAALDARDARYGESNPVLYREMMDPLFASTAADDVRNLSWYERLGKGFDRGQLMVEQGQLAWKLMRNGQLSEPESTKLTEITRQMDAYAFDDGMWALTGETVGQMSQTMPIAMGAGAVAAGLVGAVTGGSGAAPTFAAVTGLVGYGQTAEIEGGLAFLQYKRSGMDHRTAVTNATMVGRINGLVEMLPLGTVGGQFARAGRNIARKGASQIASRNGLRGAVRRMMAQRTAKRSWSNTAKNWALGTTAEVSAEMVQETVTALGEYYGQVDTQALRTAQVGEVPGDFNMPGGGTIRTLPDGTVQVSNEILDIVDGVIPIGSAGRRANEFHTLTPEQAKDVIADLDRIYPLESVLNDETMASDIIKLTSDTAWSALKGMWLVGAAGPLMQHASERAQVKKSQIDHQVFADNVDKAAESKLNKRSPSAFARFWQLQAEEGDDSVFISRTDLDEKMSTNGITIDDLDQVFPGIKDQYGLDPESHPDIEIPKGEAVSKFANNQLFDIFKDVLRPNQEAISQKDLEKMGPNIDAQKKALEAQLAEDEQVVDARDAELDVIEENIANQLIGAGTKVSMARVQAAWSRSYVAVRALAKTKQLGRQVLPSEIRLPSIVSSALYEQGQDQGDNFSQIDTQSDVFRNWFGDSKVVDESGAPLVVYHGTDKTFSEFKAGPTFFSPNPYYAAKYARLEGGRTIPAFLSSKSMFDTRIPEHREIFEERFFRKFGNGAPLNEQSLPDWTDAEDLQEFFESEGLDFDGAVIGEPPTMDGSGGFNAEYSYVVFDPTQIKSTQNLGTFDSSDPNILRATEGTVTRGSFDKRTGQIIIGKDHNGSTFFHEWSHFHLQVLIEDVAAGTATEQDVKDLETIAKWGGHASAKAFIDASPAAHRATHEAWAAAFEQYLYENNADSAEMRGVFRRVADLLVESWRQIKRIGENYQRIYGQPLPVMNPEITAVMDRLLMTDDQITTRMQQDAVSKLLNGVEVTPEEQATLDDLYFNQESEAKEELRKRFMKQLRKLRSFRGRELKRLQSASRKARKQAEEDARDTLLREEPRARLVHWLTTGELIEFAPDGEMIVREKLADTAKIATTDPRVPKKFRRMSPELAEDMELEAELELIEAEESLAEEAPILEARIEGLRAEVTKDQELRKVVKAEQRVVRKSGNKTLLEENEGVIADAEERIANSKAAIKTAQDELREWKRLVKSAQTELNRAKAVTMKASDPARQVDDGIDPKFLANKFGFDSVDDVLTGTEFDLEEETHQAADKLMEDESPELASAEGIQTAVSEAVNNEALLRVRSSELSVLDKTGPSQSLLMATAKMVAKRVVEGRLFRELATHEDETPAQLGERRNKHAMGLGRKFEIAALKAERDARAARDARDLETMRKHQRTALQQRALSAEAYSQRDKLRKDMDRITSILKVSGAKRESQLARAYGGAAVESARMMLLAVGLGDEAMARRIAGLSINGKFDPSENSPLSAVDKAELASAVNAAKAIGAETGGDYRRMEIGALREFLVGIDGVLNMARRLRQIQIGEQTVMIEDLAESLKQQADAEGRVIPDNQQKEKENIARRLIGPMNEKWQRMEALLYAMDGNKYGTLTQAIWQPIADAVNRLNEDEVRILNKFKDIVRPLREAVRGDQELAGEITAEYLIDPGTGKPFVFRQGKLGIIGALVHSGSDSNLKRLVHGWKWGLYDAETDTLDRSAWDAQVAEWEASGMVTEADWQMVQSIWDLYDEMLPAMRRAHYDAMGFDMVLTERTPVQTRWGEIKGGYVPAALDRDKQPVRQDVRDANEILEAQKQMPTVARGMTQGRVNYDFRALDLDILRQVEHFHKHLMFTHLAAPAKQLISIVYNDDVNVQLERLYPGFTENHLKHWIETVTTQSSTLGQHQDIDGAASLWNVLRRNTGSAAMIGNIRNALQGVGGIALAAARVRPRYLMLAAYDYFRSPYRSRDAIQDKSRMMRLRHVKGNNIYEVMDAINELHESGNAFIRNTEKLRAFLAKHTYIAQELIQKPLDRIVWLGAYKQAVDAGKSESAAIREADGAVRQTQHDSTPMSLASGEKGTPLQKLVSQFMGWFVMMASLRGGDFHNQTRLSALMLVIGPMLTTMVIGEIVSEMLDEHEDDDTWDKVALRIAGNSVFSLPRAFGIPGVIASTALQSSVGSALGTAENYQMRMPQPAAFALVGRAMAAGRQWVDAMTSESGKASVADAGTDFIEIIGALFGIPIGVVTNRVQAGITDDDASVRGFINGR